MVITGLYNDEISSRTFLKIRKKSEKGISKPNTMIVIK